jgi:hypothetical protein
MCYTRGCNRPYDNMRSPDNITEQDFTTAWQTEAIKHAGTVEAKRHMLQLLQKELERNEFE